MKAASKDAISQLQLSKQSTHADSEDMPGCSSPDFDSGDDSPCSSPTQSRFDQRTEQARAFRLTKLAERSSGAAERDLNWRKRLVRKKIGALLDEVLRRQRLRDRQRHQKRSLEQRSQAGKGPEPTLGEAHVQALGIGDPIGTPRRQMLLKLLSTEELRMIRDDTMFFLDDGREDRGAGLLGFFFPQKAEVDDFEHYIQRLQREVEELRTRSQTSLPWVPQPKKKIIAVSSKADTWHLGDEGWVATRKPFTRMPCQCGKLPNFDDTRSPILQKVRAVCEKRDAMEERLIEGRLAEVTRRAAVNAFKVKQQQLELNQKVREKKELSKVQTAETIARKDEIDLLAQQHADDLAAQRLVSLDVAKSFRERSLWEKRAQVTLELARCQEVTEAAEDQQASEEGLRRVAARQRHAAADERIREWAEHRYDEIQTVVNHEALRTRIQRCLKAQSESSLELSRTRRGFELEDRLQAAKERRTAIKTGSLNRKYCFVEKAFGPEALKGDPRLDRFISRKEDWVRRTL
eukprot:gnl/MRDRNA2_/MRDRNA2_120519_c0_seq1.p1 gnl/MRDRNA2_/MRDRNA2_120519_c0~~gnl/MRDRNA2_/MRDRNA2_120519_c0_seq1.p1  ORF type:complete len:519 (-),score=133.59 gnl/MRDRNA2_/MRDRNA2_120519_c0_seq1:81-1637(-)